MSDTKVVRFSVRERLVHWTVALVFVYSALTGLAFWSPRLYWLTGLLGGGTTVRSLHPWAGILFLAAFVVMFQVWHRTMRLDPADRQWLKRSHRYASHDFRAMPEAGRFNGGQKALFWLQAVNGILLAASGAFLWFPELASRPLREVAIFIHPATAMVAIGALVVHIYMGTAATPGAFRGMTQGWVTRSFAASHHPRWYRERE